MNENLIAYFCAYFIGSIPFGLVLAQIFAKTNITKSGSHSIGATNVLRVLKQTNPKIAKKVAILTIICDALKGLLPLVIAKYAFGLSPSVLWTMGVLAVIGHCFSIYLKFEGGKGIATGAAVLGFFLPLELLCALIAWFIAGKVLKISSLASLIALSVLVVFSFIIDFNMPYINTHAPILIIAFIVFYKHLPNIYRLIQGKEKKVI